MSIATDLATLKAFLEEFEPFLKSETVFWNVGAAQTALSLAGVLFLARKLQARQAQLTTTQAAEFAKLEQQTQDQLQRWAVNSERKALKEISSRLNVWISGWEELPQNYKQTVSQRVYLELLFARVAAHPDAAPYRARLVVQDARLRHDLTPGDFIWEPELAAAFPRPTFWFLYGQPQRHLA